MWRTSRCRKDRTRLPVTWGRRTRACRPCSPQRDRGTRQRNKCTRLDILLYCIDLLMIISSILAIYVTMIMTIKIIINISKTLKMNIHMTVSHDHDHDHDLGCAWEVPRPGASPEGAGGPPIYPQPKGQPRLCRIQPLKGERSTNIRIVPIKGSFSDRLQK